MDTNLQEMRIAQLEKKVDDLTNALSSILTNSSASKISFKNEVQFSKIGKIGFFGKIPAGQQTTTAVATDAATTLALANSIRTLLINLGLSS